MRNIQTEKAYIGWYAIDYDSYDGPGSPLGWGSTKEEAIEHLKEQLEEEEE